MNTRKKSIPKFLLSATLATAIVAGTGWLEPLGAQVGRVQFKPPRDTAPQNTASGATRGTIRFEPPGQSAPNNTAPGASRGTIKFQPPGQASPNNTAPGGSRGNRFQPPGDTAPNRTTSGATRGSRFQPPGDNAPGNTTSGATRGDDTELPSAVVPTDSNYGRTMTARPTLLVYVPPTTSKEAFFSIQDASRSHHYQTLLPIPSEGGIVSITIPADAPALEVGQDYQWHFVVLNSKGTLEPDSYGINGWIERVQPSETPAIESNTNSSLPPIEQAALYAEQGIWYDTASVLFLERLARPNDDAITTEWQNLLSQVGLEELASKPVAQSL